MCRHRAFSVRASSASSTALPEPAPAAASIAATSASIVVAGAKVAVRLAVVLARGSLSGLTNLSDGASLFACMRQHGCGR